MEVFVQCQGLCRLRSRSQGSHIGDHGTTPACPQNERVANTWLVQIVVKVEALLKRDMNCPSSSKGDQRAVGSERKTLLCSREVSRTIQLFTTAGERSWLSRLRQTVVSQGPLEHMADEEGSDFSSLDFGDPVEDEHADALR